MFIPRNPILVRRETHIVERICRTLNQETIDFEEIRAYCKNLPPDFSEHSKFLTKLRSIKKGKLIEYLPQYVEEKVGGLTLDANLIDGLFNLVARV